MPKRVKVAPMPASAQTQLPPRKSWPKLLAAEQALIGDYLLGWMAVAMEALDQSQAMHDAAPDTPGFAGRAEYWRNVVSGLKWAYDHLPHKQRYLAIQAALKAQPNGKP